MFKSNLVTGLVTLVFFLYAQTQGWNLFEQGPAPKPLAGSSGKAYHK